MSGAQTLVLRHLAGSGECLEVAEIAAEMTDLSARQIVNAAGKLVSRGLVERRAVGCFVATGTGVALAESGAEITSGPRGPLTGLRRPRRAHFTGRVWRALRLEKKATINELIALAEPGEMKDPSAAANRYLSALRRAGFVLRMPHNRPGTALTSPGYRVYMLLPDHDTGPEAPVYRAKRRDIYDPNTGKSHPFDEAVS